MGNVIDDMNNPKRLYGKRGGNHSSNANDMRVFLRRTIGGEASHWPLRRELSKSAQNISMSLKDAAHAYENLLRSDSDILNSEKIGNGKISGQDRVETLVRLLEDAVKMKLENESFKKEINSSPSSARVLNPTLDQVSRIFTINERQKVAFRIAGSYLLDSFKRAFLRYPPGKQLRMH